MACRFNTDDDTLEASVRRIAGEQIDAVLGMIRSDTMPPEKVIHEARRACKAIRGLIRLVKPAFRAFATENAAFRDMARGLSAARDAKVLADTLMALAQDEEQHAVRRLCKRLGLTQAKGRKAAPGLRALEEQFVAARVRVATWTLSKDGWDGLGRGFRQTYRSARRAMKQFEQTGDPQCSHEWRKQVKYHGQHMRLLRDLADGPARERVRQLDKLADLLGERHDLDVLLERLAALPAGDEAATIKSLEERARQRIEKIEPKARRLGEKLFARKPREMADQWGERWRDWLREAQPA